MKVFYSFFVLNSLLDFCLCFNPFAPLSPANILEDNLQCADGNAGKLVDRFGVRKLTSKLIELLSSSSVDKNDVKFFLYIKDRIDGKTGSIEISSDSLYNFSSEHGNFNRRKIIMIIPGFLSSRFTPEIRRLRDGFFRNGNYNIIVVDWKAAQLSTQLAYQAVVNKLDSVAEHVSKLLRSIENSGMGYLNEITIVGHSLGAHLAGITGYKLGGKIGRIVGLDPAGPLFSTKKLYQRLSEDDAMEVEVIHTNIKGCGSEYQMGHYDFYVNGGKSQPGCWTDKCSHFQAYQYFIESLHPYSKGFYGKLCDDRIDEQFFSDSSSLAEIQSKCRGQAVLMGGLSKKHVKPGKYYVETNEKSPYAQGRSQ